jgi:ketosteroid isomerase-like protein
MSKLGRLAIGLTVIALLATSLALAGDKSDMAGRIVSWQKLYNSGDFDALAAQYTEDATRMPYQAPKVQGRAAIAEMNRTFHDAGAVKIELELVGSESSGGMGWAQGTYHLMDSNGETFQKGKWMNVSKKVGKEWLILADIWNTDAP